MKIYFDSNICIDYLWGHYESGSVKKYLKKIIDFIENNNHKVVSSIFLFTEISSHFRDWCILKKIVKRGHSHRELSKLKKQKKFNSLTKSQQDKITKSLEYFNNKNWVDSVELKELNKDALDLFSVLTLKYYIDFPDAIHIIIAMNEGCNCFLTKDNEVIDRVRLFLEDYKIPEGDFFICDKDEFIAKYID